MVVQNAYAMFEIFIQSSHIIPWVQKFNNFKF